MTETAYKMKGLAAVNGTYLYYEIVGLGYPLTLIHGGLVDRRLWDDQFEVFAQQRYCTIRYDMRGFGNSAVATEPFSHLDDLYGLLRFLGVKKTYLMGLSMGGGLAIDFTLEHPEMVNALIPVASGLSGYQSPEDHEQIWHEIEELITKGELEQVVELENRIWTDGPNRMPEQVNPIVRRRVHEMNLHNHTLQTSETPSPRASQTNAINRLSEIHVPTLVIAGAEDQPDILRIADLLTTGIAGARKVIIPNTAHHLNMEQPEQFNRAVLEFLAGLS
jgi:3-oxoadipate enol-lactonase